MSTSISHPNSSAAWKQEVNRRIAAHRGRRAQSTAISAAPATSPQGPTGRAAQAAARVAARYAKAPTYNEMQAAEAHAMIREAQIATQVAQEAQAAAKAAVAGLQAAAAARQRWEHTAPQPAPPSLFPSELALVAEPAEPAEVAVLEPPQVSLAQTFWEEEPVQGRPEPMTGRSPRRSEAPTLPVEEGWDEARSVAELPLFETIEFVEPELPIYGNLIEFPREVVAKHKARPRLADGPFATMEAERQLSIFEVDPVAISSRNEADGAHAAAVATLFAGAEWSGIELDAQPVPEAVPQDEVAHKVSIELASFGRRLLAAVVDGALITGAFLVAALVAASNIEQAPAPRVVEQCAVAGLVLIGLLYQAIFTTLAGTTPGMKYARVGLCTFDDRSPNRAQLHGRFGALLLSLIPVGLGLAWAIFDEDHLCWHDRLSHTYLRRR